ncbi:hypothetical protein LTR78_003234 [Recurvomyces mirabilis]|uniref:Indole-diterpene biosynthesis protein PaxU n=1 Tax=Recurvomyces mirabilis TaxID=574656 RepID=A0AAE1C409_9PEZI|nr:hypothetical protein LTR78_003234 [Recurvomyces mirabilis]KAK5156949.1 hypothetical protein LTS14_004466 [Recurvomyces mirabilis]
MTTKFQPLDGFVHLTDTTSISRPQPNSKDTKSITEHACRTIIICAWFRAQSKHIAKYTTHYCQRYPDAQILLLECVYQDMLTTPYATQQSRLQPAIEILQAAQRAGHAIFLHSFSNGGSHTAVQLAAAWKQKKASPLPILAMALDSSPGSPSLTLAAAAIIFSFPKSARWWVTVIVWTIVVPIISFPALLGSDNVVHKLRKELVDPDLFSVDAPRVYLYSKVDEMVPHASVEEHVALARRAGYGVKTVLFEKSAHVAHVNEDRDKYWAAVESVMSGSRQRNGRVGRS